MSFGRIPYIFRPAETLWLTVEVHLCAENEQKDLNTKINRIYFKKMKTKWASPSQNNNLTVNTLTKHLPKSLIDYVKFHETAHSIERKHNETFWELVDKKFPDHSDKENDLLTFWFLIQAENTNA